MDAHDIRSLLASRRLPDPCAAPELVETHISWVILCDRHAYKIKKPIRYSFLDFSTAERRRKACEKEVSLNRRLAPAMYLDVQPVVRTAAGPALGESDGEVCDHAVRMRRMDRSRQMDVLLAEGRVGMPDIRRLAAGVARFHARATIIPDCAGASVGDKFRDLEGVAAFLAEALGPPAAGTVRHAVELSDRFVASRAALIAAREGEGFCRDGHGDLHTRNIFLLPEPVIFDCIEFNDAYRQTDVLNEVAFLCMDLEAFGRDDLSEAFLQAYNAAFPALRNDAEHTLFTYYKAYRANIRAKVNGLRARSASDPAERHKALAAASKYLSLMTAYLESLSP